MSPIQAVGDLDLGTVSRRRHGPSLRRGMGWAHLVVLIALGSAQTTHGAALRRQAASPDGGAPIPTVSHLPTLPTTPLVVSVEQFPIAYTTRGLGPLPLAPRATGMLSSTMGGPSSGLSTMAGKAQALNPASMADEALGSAGLECSGHGTKDGCAETRSPAHSRSASPMPPAAHRYGRCVCKRGYSGEDCSYDVAANTFIASDCVNLSKESSAACYRITNNGPCSSYKLAWAPLCRRTCTSMQGQPCPVASRMAFCMRAPECEPLVST